ncbi:MAG: HlyD family efflux transporter periplasmic adaptor subunit [Aquimonas sp.]|nr:HlyD family efflux transporter periplasmic adaptor subunit [Aquimonas sp.]
MCIDTARRIQGPAALLALATLALPLPAAAQLLSGEVIAAEAEAILVPPSNSSPVVLRYLVPEGAQVQPGDPLVRIDPGQALAQVRSLENQIEQLGARIEKELADLALAVLDAELEAIDTTAELARAEVDAGIPASFLPPLEYDRFQNALERQQREQRLKREQLAAARAAVERRRADGRLELEKLEAERIFNRLQVEQSEQRASRAGTVTHGFDTFRGLRYAEGSSAYPGNRIGEVVGEGGFRVRAFALEPERALLSHGQTVWLQFDALPGRVVEARISSISAAPEAKAEWGAGRYHTLLVDAPALAALPLRAGMSARVQLQPPTPSALPTAPATAIATAPTFEGELFARDSAALMPPAIEELWQFNITELAPDGSEVEEGQVVVGFDAGQLMQNLLIKQSQLAEKRSELDKLLLQQDDRARSDALQTAQQAADLDKAERKASQPEGLVGRNDYRKLVIDRERARQRMEQVRLREIAATHQRTQERRLLQAEVEQLDSEVQVLQQGMLAMSVRAPRAGLMLHRSNWQGDKFEVGAQVWMGVAVAEIPDPESLAVRGTAPERELGALALGQAARISLQGGTRETLSGRVVRLGSTVRSRSRLQPVPVVDVEIELDARPQGLRPGQAVQIELLPMEAASLAAGGQP